VKGITLSSAQMKRGNELNFSKGLGEKVSLQVSDALETPFEKQSFDLIWSCESAEHMVDKKKLLEECLRQLKVGGLLLIATWCHRDSPSLSSSERSFLKTLYDIWALPFFISIQDYSQILRELQRTENFTFKVEDWTKPVHNFWWDIIRTRATFTDFIWLLSCGPRMVLRTIRDLYGSYLMHEGYRKGIVTYGVIAVRKSAA
jgi:tocopherol O-methyltransferase